ncbi:hypothetical protein IWQ62_004973 [Dispira parvispora]|uniref:Protein Abitram n=1 Tax=Dispira parvispora TaxID=1520584 RepID=A0A9W8ARB0_9FUNG|nr:hypothetical protein IWQ62_004973 [Dispira parvispora]
MADTDNRIAQYESLTHSWLQGEEKGEPWCQFVPRSNTKMFLDRYYTRSYFVPGLQQMPADSTIRTQDTLVHPQSSDEANVALESGDKATTKVDSGSPSLDASRDKQATAEKVPMVTDQTTLVASQIVWQAPNQLCLVGLAREHDLFNQYTKYLELVTSTPSIGPFIARIDFASWERLDEAGDGKPFRGNKRKGRRGKPSTPKGALSGLLFPNSPLCTLTLYNGQTVSLVTGVHRGHVVEINERLRTDPDLLLRAPNHGGYVAIVKPIQDNSKVTLKACVNPLEFQDLWQRHVDVTTT